MTTESKTYYSVVPFCNLYITRAPSIVEAVSIVAGMIETSDPEVIAHLDAICDKPGTGITSRKVGADMTAANDARKAGEIAQTKAVNAGLTTA